MRRTGIPTDASALIYLAKADVFALASRCLGALAIPPSVWIEVVEAGKPKDVDELARIRLAERDGFLVHVGLTERIRARSSVIKAEHSLGSGESEVLALTAPGSRVVLDERGATRIARKMGLVPTPTLKLPVIGVRRGKIPLRTALEMLDRLARVSGARGDVVIRLRQLTGRDAR